MPSIRRIGEIEYYAVKKTAVCHCARCGKKIPINASAYAKGSQGGSQIFCRDCIIVLSDQYQFEKYGRIPFPKTIPLYVGLIGHTCSTLDPATFATKPAIFRRGKHSAILAVSHCTKCDRYFVTHQEFQKNTSILYDYCLIHTITEKPIPGSRSDTKIFHPPKNNEQEIPASVIWAYMHPYQGGGCSGK